MFMQRKSSNGKMRDISYLSYNPNQIFHQSLVVAGDERMEKHLIYDTYASRIGKGQIAGALRVKQWLVENPQETVWYGQGDVTKYFDSIPHEEIRRSLERLFKDELYINTLMEPIEKHAKLGIPLGIRPSQVIANLVLSEFDHWAKEDMGMKYYVRYMDDYVVLCKTKGEVKQFMKAAQKKLNEIKLVAHVDKIHRVSNGLSYLGYVFHENGEMYWRRNNKAQWLKRRHKITNKKRLQEIDAAAWGMLKHGNKQCKKLFKMRRGLGLKELGIKLNNSIKGKDGKKFFDAPRINASVVLNNKIDVIDWEKDITTSQGDGRWVLLISFYGKEYRLIINSMRIKKFIIMLEEKEITSFSSMMIDRAGNRHYDFDFDSTEALTIKGEKV